MTPITALRRTTSLFAAGALAFTLLAACGDDDQSVEAGGDGAQGGARSLVLRMELIGGFLPPEEHFRIVPSVSVYSDGLVITQGAQIEIFPPPALPALVESHLSDDELDDLLADARDSGVFEAEDFGEPPVADAGSTAFTLVEDDEPRQVVIYALGIDDGPGITDEQRANRQKALALQERLGEIPGRPDEELWTPDRVALLVSGPVTEQADEGGDGAAMAELSRFAQAEDPETTEETLDPDTPVEGPDQGPPDDGIQDPGTADQQDWPGPDLANFGEELGQGQGRCGVVDGATAQTVLDAAAQANTQTLWRSGDAAWRVTFRPMLPDEQTCGDVLDMP